jgi:hypothetical protein
MFQFVGASRAFTVSFTTLRGEHIVSSGKYDTRSTTNKDVEVVADPINGELNALSYFFLFHFPFSADLYTNNVENSNLMF